MHDFRQESDGKATGEPEAVVIIEVNSDSETWLKLKHAIRASGQRYSFQQQLFDKHRVTLHLEDVPEPKEGRLVSGMIVYDGGARIPIGLDSKVFEVYAQETGAST